MLIWYDEELNKEFEVKICGLEKIVDRDDCVWKANSHIDKYGQKIDIWMVGTDKKEVYLTISRIERLAKVNN